MKNTNKELVINGRQTVRALVLSTLGLIYSIVLSIAVLTISVKIFGIDNLNPVIIGERIGLLVWIVGIVAVIAKTVKSVVCIVVKCRPTVALHVELVKITADGGREQVERVDVVTGIEVGIMDATGLLAEPWFKKGFPLAPGISFTQDDIREFQMAKAAVRTGLQILTSGSGISLSDIGRVFIAGGMGHGLDLKKASLAGLIPSELLSITEAVGNASLKGAVKFLLSGDAGSASVKKTASLAREIPLAEDAEFNEAYIDNIDFS